MCTGPLWETNPSMAVVLWVTMPSPMQVIVDCGSQLQKFCQLSQPTLPSLQSPLPIVPLQSLSPPLPYNYVYVGAGNPEFPIKPSPWLNPFDILIPSASIPNYVSLMKSRPDCNYV